MERDKKNLTFVTTDYTDYAEKYSREKAKKNSVQRTALRQAQDKLVAFSG